MAQSSVDLIVNAVKAVNPLRAVSAASKKTEQQSIALKRRQKIQVTSSRIWAARARRFVRPSCESVTSGGQVWQAGGKAAALCGSWPEQRRFLNSRLVNGSAGKQTKSLQVLTGSLETAKGIISGCRRLAQSLPASTELIETSKRLKAFGFEIEQIVDNKTAR